MVASMAVMAREAWTDERLDDLKENVNQRFDQVDKRFDQVDQRFSRIEAEMKTGFAQVDRRIDSLQRTMVVCFATLSASIWAAIIGAVLAALL